MKELENKIALITGGSSGIGRETAIAFAELGAKVVIASRGQKESEETVKLVQEAGSEAIFVQTDVSQAQSVENLIYRAVGTYGPIDYAFNNAGIEGKRSSIIEQTESDWNEVIDINLKGTWLSMKYEIAQMLKQGGGAIVNNVSSSGLIGSPVSCIYGASKHGIIGLTKSLAIEYAKAGISINAVCPGAIDTDMLDRLWGDNKAELARSHPIGRIGTPAEVAKA